MKQFHIHHSTGENRFTETESQPREYAGIVYADSVEDAYQRSQNFTKLGWNPINPCRSTSVGDIIQDDDDFYMVCNMGFKLLVPEAV